MMVVIGLLVWILLGAALGLYETRRGHWSWLWLLGAIAGPFSLPLFRQLERNEGLARPYPLTTVPVDGPGLRVLVGVDGSDASRDAALGSVDVLGASVAGVTLAMVADYDVSESVPGPLLAEDVWDPDEKELVTALADDVAAHRGITPSTVLLVGRPAQALQAYAEAEGLDVIVVGTRGRGLTKRLVGSCASQLVQSSRVPVLVMPDRPAEPHDEGRRADHGRAVSS